MFEKTRKHPKLQLTIWEEASRFRKEQKELRLEMRKKRRKDKQQRLRFSGAAC